LDPLLTAFYARLGYGYFANDLYVLRMDGTENQWEEQNRWWRNQWQHRSPMPLIIFGGMASLAYYYATVPGLADEEGRQPVVKVDAYDADELHAIPVASNVERFFDAYSRYLEVLVSTPGFEPGDTPLSFPWDVPEILGRDERLVALLRAGRFTPLMKATGEERAWAARVVAAAQARH
jgi:hypothetical protein